MSTGLQIWTIYDHPTDHPYSFVARQFVNDQPTDLLIVAPTLQNLRDGFEALGLSCIARSEADDPVIVECWL